jgi:hypothetical protein
MLDRPMMDRSNRRSIGVDPFVIGTLVAGLLIALLLIFGNGGFPSDTKGLTLGPTQPNFGPTMNSGSSKP